MSSWIALGLLIVAGAVLVLNNDTGTIAGFEPGDFAGLVAGLALLVFLGGSMLSGYRGRFTGAVRDAVFWGVLGLALIAGYSYRDQVMPIVHRIGGELVPGMPVGVDTGNPDTIGVRIRKQTDGHFLAHTRTNGARVDMIVDTGASTVVLRPSDAKKAGIDVSGLTYSVPVRTANGTALAARVRLNNVSIGSVTVDNVEALITKPGALHESLLGMSFLSRLRSYEFSGDFLTLRS
ncbi:MAG: TIGR02281 family clan AA aspartic protease [Hyphomicrobiaceae bacterium]|nr:TIGR02281 family clan AA aspartic protease [Hyphomicrobiaceae bacterium]